MVTNKAAKGTMWLWSALMVLSTLVSGVQAQTLPPSAPVEFIPSGSAQGDNIGDVVALSRDYAVIGAPRTDVGASIDHGAVYVYKKSGGQWSYFDTLQPAQLSSSDYFGSSVAIYQAEPNTTAPTRLAVGAPGQGSGKVYVYALASSPERWELEHEFEAPSTEHSQQFGIAVSIVNNTLVIGDNGDRTNHDPDAVPPVPSLGMVYVYQYEYDFTQLGWDYLFQSISPNDLTTGNYFGTSVAISDDESTIAVGNPRTSSFLSSDGSVQVFTKSGTQYSYTATLQPCSGTSERQELGTSVSIDGNWIVAGAPYHNDWQGTVYAYNKTGATWADHACQHLTRYNAGPDDLLGWSIDIDGSIIVAGAPGFGSHEDFMNVYRLGVTTLTEGLWIEQPKMTEAGGAQDALFGHGVAVDEQVAMVGAPDSDDDANAILDTGSFFIINTIVSIEPGCLGDIASDGSRFAVDEPDGYIGVADFFAVLQAWGPCANPSDCPANIVDDLQNPEYAVDIDDFFFVLQHWGPCTVTDTDGDGISDFWENHYGISSFDDPTDAFLDHDNDGLSTLDEITVHGTHPNDADSDDDGVNDGAEVLGESDPLDDSDNGVGPNSDNIVYVMLEFGDPSCHNSDIWHMHFGGVEYEFVHDAASSGCQEPENPLDPDDCSEWTCPNHAPQQKGPIAIERGREYEIRMTHHGTAYLDGDADYDWACLVYLYEEDGSILQDLLHDADPSYYDHWEPLPPVNGVWIDDPDGIMGKA
jgi:hypothetical protein